MSKYYNFRNLDILFVDDNKNMHSLLKSLLLAMNVVNSRGCYTSEECFDCMLEEAPDIVITDMSLNPENGIDLIRRIRQGEKGVDRYTPILVLSGQTALKHVITARDAGATEFLAKPVSVGSLHDRLVWMIENPRPFIKASTYIGPDRRRAMRGYEGMERRQ
ncbi:response regulator [uncultured Sneathiella sp.]|jgi:DNA-binding response OmpR family regulator|uniref:response regulator transcription factor n=1 Tax=uncultured Sneathiella sp. TaxID=879315 RepID=UPI0030D9A6FD|tara:strand:- start:1830 stop:2315 length:486 start_codon:yes stop_codon:yes gene_type:complete